MNDSIENLKSYMKEKEVEQIDLNELLVPDIKYLIDVSPLSAEDRQLAELLYVRRVRPCEAIDKMNYGSSHTYYRHKKIVENTIKQVLIRLTK